LVPVVYDLIGGAYRSVPDVNGGTALSGFLLVVFFFSLLFLSLLVALKITT